MTASVGTAAINAINQRSQQPSHRNHLATTDHIQRAVARVISGKDDKIRLALAVLLAEGHLLIEDVPGVGKTSLAKALARAIDCTVRRIQFTPDLMPGDVTGVSVYNRHFNEFEFKPGAIFANVVIADEINRASPKTQAALLESMEERHVTIDGVSHPLFSPFVVIATQNPIELEGTYPLPEAQLDRFTARIAMGYPDRAAELAMLSDHADTDPLASLVPVVNAGHMVELIDIAHRTYVAASIREYVLSLVAATRQLREVRLGASPRAALHLIRVARALAFLNGRNFVLPDDVRDVAVPVLAHRLVLAPEARARQRGADQLVTDLLARIQVPTADASGAR